ncbi:MAG: dinucleotide-utilizing protein [Sphingobacteriaceae bacterium]|nr:MAG: dinucleotide-utilizing protein [Sphingobacteriaceae bacterium]
MQTYYQSHQQLNFIGSAGQQQLNLAKVLVIGAGGLGCPCLLHLATSGVGNIGVADFDTVSLSNLHRQTLYNFDDVEKSKVKTASQNLLAHNPNIQITEHDFLVDETSVLGLIQNYDVVVDGTDNFLVRYLINDACVVLNKPLVYGAIYQTEGQVTVFNHQNSPTLRCLFPEPPPENAIQSCAEIGAYNITTSIVGTMMAGEVIKIILSLDTVFTGKLIYVDVFTGKNTRLTYHENPASRAISLNRFAKKETPVAIAPKDFQDIFQHKNFKLIDVRSDDDHEDFNIGGTNIPLAKLSRFPLNTFSADENLVFYCQQGLRSHQAAEFFRQAGFKNAFSLQGGLSAYKNHLSLFVQNSSKT